MIAEKSSDSLFTLDTTGSAVIQKSYNKVHKPLKADEILAQRSVVPVIDSHKKPSGTTNGIIEPSSKKRKTNSVSLKEYERLRSVAYGTQSVKDIIKPVDTSDYDPWSLTNPDEASQDPKFSYLEKKKPIRAPPTLREAPVSLTASKGQAPAVPAPKPGTSYNPVFEDWDALLVSEGAKEIEAEKKRLQAAAIETARLERIAAAEQEREREHDGDGVPTEDESAWEGFESDFLGAEWLKKKRPERKTPAERNKIKRRQEAERRRKAEVKEKERERQQKQLGEIIKRTREKAKAKARSVERLEKEREETQQEEVDEKVLRRRRFGKDAYVTIMTLRISFANLSEQSSRTSVGARPTRRITRFAASAQAGR